MKLSQKDVERFHQHYQTGSGDECWEWSLSRNHNGYGRFRVSGIVERAHRISFRIHHGSIPEGMLVCHRCDNPGCVNPAHLWLGTSLDNQRDKIRKGRGRCSDQYGERNPRATMTEMQAKEAIELIAAGLSNKEIAAQYGVTHSSISNLRRCKTWKKLRRPDSHSAFEPYASLKTAARAVFSCTEG